MILKDQFVLHFHHEHPQRLTQERWRKGNSRVLLLPLWRNYTCNYPNINLIVLRHDTMQTFSPFCFPDDGVSIFYLMYKIAISVFFIIGYSLDVNASAGDGYFGYGPEFEFDIARSNSKYNCILIFPLIAA